MEIMVGGEPKRPIKTHRLQILNGSLIQHVVGIDSLAKTLQPIRLMKNGGFNHRMVHRESWVRSCPNAVPLERKTIVAMVCLISYPTSREVNDKAAPGVSLPSFTDIFTKTVSITVMASAYEKIFSYL